MLPGYNHNVQYKGSIYHIQTEDSGVDNPHIITLLYIKGNIISRKKTSYQDILKSERLHSVVKELMQEQHKSMLRELKTGIHDERILLFQGSKPAGDISDPASQQAVPGAPPALNTAPTRPPVVDEASEHDMPAAPAPLPPPPPPPKEGEKILELSDDKELSDEDIFGADLISDKSLDEVILNYLAADTDSGGEK